MAGTGEKLFKIFWFIALLTLSATFGVGWALGIYALIVLLIVVLVKFSPRRGS